MKNAPKARWDELTIEEREQLAHLANHLASFGGSERGVLLRSITTLSREWPEPLPPRPLPPSHNNYEAERAACADKLARQAVKQMPERIARVLSENESRCLDDEGDLKVVLRELVKALALGEP